MLSHSLRGVPAARNLAKLSAMGLLPAEPLGTGSTGDYYKHLGATEPYTGGFSPTPKPREATPPPSDQFAQDVPDPDTEYAPDPDFKEDTSA